MDRLKLLWTKVLKVFTISDEFKCKMDWHKPEVEEEFDEHAYLVYGRIYCKHCKAPIFRMPCGRWGEVPPLKR